MESVVLATMVWFDEELTWPKIEDSIMTQESDVCKVGECSVCNDSIHWIYNRSCCKLVYTLTIVLESIFGRADFRPVFEPFLRVQKWGKIGVGSSFSDIKKLSMLLYDILTTPTCWWCCYHNTQKVVKHQKRGSGAEKKSADKVPSIRRFRRVP